MKRIHIRPVRTRLLRVEALESRELLAATGVNESGLSDPGNWYELSEFASWPTPVEQEMLELINRMRSDPAAELRRLVTSCDPEAEGGPWLGQGNEAVWNDRFFSTLDDAVTQNCRDRYPAKNSDTLRLFLSQWSSLSSAAPLAFHASLTNVANEFVDYLIGHPDEFMGRFVHNVNLGRSLAGEFLSYGENVYAVGQESSPNLSAVNFFHAAFAIDWGNSDGQHRANIMNPEFSELGIAFETYPNGKSYSVVDFGKSTTGARTDGAYLLGVVYHDGETPANGQGIYNAGEGISKVTLVVRNLDLDHENTVEISSQGGGGYQLFLQNGNYSITAIGNNSSTFKGTVTKYVTINGQNKKVDFLTTDYSVSAPFVDLGGDVYYDYGVVATFQESSDRIQPIDQARMSIRDRDSTRLTSATIRLMNRPNGEAEQIGCSTLISDLVNISMSYTDGTVTLQGEADFQTYISIISSLYWSFDESRVLSGKMSYEDRKIGIVVSDGSNESVERFVTIRIDPTDPVLSITSNKVYEGDGNVTYITFEAQLDTPARVRSTCIVTPVRESGLPDAFATEFFVDTPVELVFNAGEQRCEFQIAVMGNYDRQRSKTGDAAPNATYRIEDDPAFTLEVSECNGLAWRGDRVLGTVIDDDTPITVIVSDHWEYVPQLPFQTQYGTQRFLYAIEARSSGLMTWSVDSDVPSGFTLSVYDSNYSETPIAGATLKTGDSGQTLQWSVVGGKTYVIKIEKRDKAGSAFIANQKYGLLQVTTDNVVMVDPLLPPGRMDQKIQVHWDEDGTQLNIDDNIWTLANNITVSTEKAGAVLELLFDGNGGDFASDGNSALFSPDSGQQGSFTGFTDIYISGKNRLETLIFEGTPGDDLLEFENGTGSGTFTTNAGTEQQIVYRFSDVTDISFSGGSGGNDSARILDSRFDDYIDTDGNAFSVSGGGYRISAVDFPKVEILCLNGGANTLTLANEQEDLSVMLFPQSMTLSGSIARTSTPDTKEKFSCDIRHFDHFVGKPVSYLDTLYVIGGNNTSAQYETGIGWFRSYDVPTSRTARAENVRKIIFAGMSGINKSPLSVYVDESDQLTTNEDTGSAILENTETTWRLHLPYTYNLIRKPTALTSGLTTAPLVENESLSGHSLDDSTGNESDPISFTLTDPESNKRKKGQNIYFGATAEANDPVNPLTKSRPSL